MFKSLTTICLTALIVDALKSAQRRNQLKARQAAKAADPVRKNKDELNLWHLSSASNKIARREFHGEYIGVPDDQKVVDLDFEMIIARNRG